MGQIVYKVGDLSTKKEDVSKAATVGTETLDATVGAGEIAVVMDDGVDQAKIREITYVINRLADVMREENYSTS